MSFPRGCIIALPGCDWAYFPDSTCRKKKKEWKIHWWSLVLILNNKNISFKGPWNLTIGFIFTCDNWITKYVRVNCFLKNYISIAISGYSWGNYSILNGIKQNKPKLKHSKWKYSVQKWINTATNFTYATPLRQCYSTLVKYAASLSPSGLKFPVSCFTRQLAGWCLKTKALAAIFLFPEIVMTKGFPRTWQAKIIVAYSAKIETFINVSVPIVMVQYR